MVAGMLAGVTAAMLAAGGGGAGPAVGTDAVRGEGVSGVGWVQAEARFAPPTALVPSDAVTYDQDLVPAGAWIEVSQLTGDSGTTVTARVKGLRPGMAYGAHVHTQPCAADPDAAGGHYQHRKDPVQPSKDPAYVNPGNEVWLDFTTDEAGSGRALARHSWGFRSGEARSVVLHAEQGGSGDRLACFTVPFVAPGAGGPAGAVAADAGSGVSGVR